MAETDAQAEPLEPEGYNLTKYCWNGEKVLGAWQERAGLTGRMVVRAMETLAWQRDLVRAGYPAAMVSELIGRGDARLVAAAFSEAARVRALEGLVADLDAARRASPGAAPIRAVDACRPDGASRALAWRLLPDDGHVRFIPAVLHEICRTQQIDADDPVRCDYWLRGEPGALMSFASQTLYSVRWSDGRTTTGRFDPAPLRSAGMLTLREPGPKSGRNSNR